MRSAASPIATLGNTPLLHLLVSMAERQMTGTLTFETPGQRQGAVVFENGTPRKTSAAAPHCRLSDLLVEFGWLDPHSAEETYAMALEQREPHGKILVDFRLLDAAGLSHVLVHQLIRKLDWVATRPPETLLGLREDLDLLAAVPHGPDNVSPLAILWGIAKGHVDERTKHAVLQRVANRPLQLHRQSVPELFGFNAAEMSLVDRLRHWRMDIGALLSQVELPRQTAEAQLYLLLLTRHIDIGDGRTPIGVAGPAAVPTPKSSGEFSAVGAARHERLANRSLATDALRRAEQLLERDRLLLAKVEAERAVELDPENPRCIALHSWIRALLPNGATELEPILACLSKALDLDPMNVHARFYRSQILKRLERMDEAIGEWRLIIELEPSHIDAQREIRLWEMRRGSSRLAKKSQSGVHPQVSLNPPPTGLFGKLFRNPR